MRWPAREGSPSPPAEGSPGKVSAKNMEKQHYLQGFLQKTCKNNNFYKVFCKKTCKNNNILKDFCNTHAKTAIFTRCFATSVQKINIYEVFCNTHAKTGLALFVVRSCRRNVEEPCSGYLWLTALNLESDNPGICQC